MTQSCRKLAAFTKLFFRCSIEQHANLVHLQQDQAHVGGINFAVAVHVSNAKHGVGVDHVEQDRHVAVVNQAVQIQVAAAQLAHVGHAVVIQVNELRERGAVD